MKGMMRRGRGDVVEDARNRTVLKMLPEGNQRNISILEFVVTYFKLTETTRAQ